MTVHGPEIPPTTAHDAQGEWWACQFPERLDTDYMAFHLQCPPCLVALRAAVPRHPNLDGLERDMDTVLRTMVELGLGVCYRTVDAASVGGGQRRQRIIVLGHRGGDPGPAAQVLGLAGDSGEDPRLDHEGRSSRPGPRAARCAHQDGGRRLIRKSRRPRSKTDYATYIPDDYLNTLNGFDGGYGPRQTNLVIDQGRLRFLTLEEWEMAQGFDPGWTSSMKDGARFTAIGDSMNVHHARWLGERLTAVDANLPMIGAPA